MFSQQSWKEEVGDILVHLLQKSMISRYIYQKSKLLLKKNCSYSALWVILSNEK